MSSKCKVVLYSAGVRELLKSEGVKSACSEAAQMVLNRCGNGYAMDTFVGKNRVNAMVYPDTFAARNDNLKNNTLLKAKG